MMFYRQLRNELYKMFARKRSWIGFGAFAVAQIIILVLLHRPKPQERFQELVGSFGGIFEEYFGGLSLAIILIGFTYTLLGALYISLVGGDIVSKEVEDGTMRMILSRPVSRLRLMIIKWLAIAIYTITLVLFISTSALILASIFRGGLGKLFFIELDRSAYGLFETNEGFFRYVRAVFSLSGVSLTFASIAFMFSCFKMKPAAATILTLSVLFVDMVLQQMPFFKVYKHWFITYQASSWSWTMHPEPPWDRISHAWIYLLIVTLLCWIIGTLRFCSRDLKT